MDTPPLSPDPPRQPPGRTDVHWPSVWQLGLSLLGALSLWGLASMLLVWAMTQRLTGAGGPDITPMFLLAAGLGFFGLLLLPSGAYALARLNGRPLHLPDWLSVETARRGILLFPLVVLAGHIVSTRPAVNWILLPPLHLFALAYPILWLLWLGSRGFRSGPPQRAWGVFGLGLVIGPAVILTAELLAAAAVLMLGTFFLATRPDLLFELQQGFERLQQPGQDVLEVFQTLEPFLLDPGVGFTIFAFVAGVVPILEELVKPIGAWLLAGRSATPADGFFAGLLSGGGYALFENLALSSQAEGWALAVTARAGTSLLHMVTAGLLGWALVLAWQQRRFGRLALVYLVAVGIHGLWNGLTLFTLTNFLDAQAAPYIGLLQPFGRLAPLGLAALTLLSLVILLAANRHLRENTLAGAPEPAPLRPAQDHGK